MKDTKGSIRDALQAIREGNSILPEGRSKDIQELEDLSIAYVDQLRKSKDVKELTKQISAVQEKLGVKEDMDVDVESIEEAPKPAKMKKLGFYGSEIGGLRQGNKYYSAKPVDVKGKVGFRVTDEFGSFETIDLKTFAKRFG